MSGPWEKFQTAPAEPQAEGPWSKFQAPAEAAQPNPSDWQARIVKVPALDPQGRKIMVDQREDGGTWRGPAAGNKGKPGWFDAQGNRLGDAPGKGPSIADRMINAGEAQHKLVTEHPAQALLSAVGNTGLAGPAAIPGSPSIAGMGKGMADSVMAPVQLAAHVAGSNAIDPAVNAVQVFYGKNFDRNRAGEFAGQMVPLVATMGGSSAAQAPAQILTTAQRVKMALASIAKGAGTGAIAAPALTPETGVQSEADYWGRKRGEAIRGAALGGALGAVGPTVGLVRSAKTGAEGLGKTPAPGEMLDELGGRLGGKAPGEALQDAAQAKYNAGWDEFKKAIAPVDAEAGNVGVDYSGPINTLKQALGVGQKRPPMPLPKERQDVLEGLLKNLEEAGKPDGLVDNSFQGAIDTIKWLGSEQRRLAVKHGDTEARQMLGQVRDSILQAMEDSSPELSQKAQEARKVFATQVAPLFDKSHGGNFLTQIRDSATPGDLLASGNQGSLARMKPDRAAIIAKGSSADPMLYSYLDAAINQAKGNPRIFSDSLKKAMPAIEAISDPETLKAFQGMVKVADTAKGAGILANLGLTAIPGYHEAGATLGLALNMKPAMSGPGLIWKVLQAPGTRKILSFASKLPAGSPELELIARDLSKRTAAVSAGSRGASNVIPLRPATLPAAADTSNPDTVAQQ